MDFYVYRFLNKKEDVIYIGKTSNKLKTRLRQHFYSSGHLGEEVYKQVDKIEYIVLDTNSEMNIIETYLINHYKPVHNQVSKESKDLSLTIDFDYKWREIEFNTVKNSSRLFYTIDENTYSVQRKTKNKNSFHYIVRYTDGTYYSEDGGFTIKKFKSIQDAFSRASANNDSVNGMIVEKVEQQIKETYILEPCYYKDERVRRAREWNEGWNCVIESELQSINSNWTKLEKYYRELR